MSNKELWDAIDVLLEGGGRVSRFYSDDDNLVVATEYGNRKAVSLVMASAGWRLYDAGANGESLMMTFKKGTSWDEYRESVIGYLHHLGVEKSKQKIEENPDWFSDDVFCKIGDENETEAEQIVLSDVIASVFKELVPGCWN